MDIVLNNYARLKSFAYEEALTDMEWNKFEFLCLEDAPQCQKLLRPGLPGTRETKTWKQFLGKVQSEVSFREDADLGLIILVLVANFRISAILREDFDLILNK